MVQQSSILSTGNAIWLEHESLLESKNSKANQRKTDRVGDPHSWFVDDILILGQTEAQTLERDSKTVQLLTQLGTQVNHKKSSANHNNRLPLFYTSGISGEQDKTSNAQST